jgi:hypothetical protein
MYRDTVSSRGTVLDVSGKTVNIVTIQTNSQRLLFQVLKNICPLVLIACLTSGDILSFANSAILYSEINRCT